MERRFEVELDAWVGPLVDPVCRVELTLRCRGRWALEVLDPSCASDSSTEPAMSASAPEAGAVALRDELLRGVERALVRLAGTDRRTIADLSDFPELVAPALVGDAVVLASLGLRIVRVADLSLSCDEESLRRLDALLAKVRADSEGVRVTERDVERAALDAMAHPCLPIGCDPPADARCRARGTRG